VNILATKIDGKTTYTLREEIRPAGPSGESRSIYWVLSHTTDPNNYHRLWDGVNGLTARSKYESMPGTPVA